MNAMLDDFLAWTLAGSQPQAERAEGQCADGVRWTWRAEGVLLLEPASLRERGRSVLVSAGIHGDETAPIELLSLLVRDIAAGRAALHCRLLVILGNVDAMRAACRYLDDDLNRLFSGRHGETPASREAPRAAILEREAVRFFGAAAGVSNDTGDSGGADVCGTPGSRWHLDLHTAIRASVFERFALLPHTGHDIAPVLFDWLGDARIEAMLLHTAKANTYSHFTAEACGALACTLELGKVRPFGENDLSRFSRVDTALRRLVAGEVGEPGDAGPSPRIFTVVDQIVRQSDAFELLVAADVPNFTPFEKGTVLARDRDYRYVVSHEVERLVFPNSTVKPGLRAGLLVVETPHATRA